MFPLAPITKTTGLAIFFDENGVNDTAKDESGFIAQQLPVLRNRHHSIHDCLRHISRIKLLMISSTGFGNHK